MKPVYFLFFILFAPFYCFSQQRLIIQGTGNALYLEHKVVPGENFYSVGRMFNVAPAEMASFNHLNMSKGLLSGQVLKIPLNKNNFSQDASAGSSEALVPVYHTVAAGETLFRIGANYKNVPLESLKQWNQMPTDQVNKNASLIVGFLKVSRTESSLAKNDFRFPADRKETPVQETAVEKNEPVRESVQPVKREAAEEKTVVSIEPASEKTNVPTGKEGFFKSQFTSASNSGEIRSANAITSVFKSTSGWQDEKYYCFSNDAKPGSIVKITFSPMNTTVYAKVLDAIPDIKQNDGVNLVLSNAAADALGTKEDHFEVIINYVR